MTKASRFGISWLLLLAFWGGFHQSAHSAVIEKVAVKSAVAGPAPEALVLANMASRPGQVFQPAVLSEDIKRLIKMGSFDDVRTEVTEMPGDKVVITVIVTPRPTVRRILFEGNRKLKTRRLRGLLEHQTGVSLDASLVAADTNAIRKRYRSSGYKQVEVDTVIQEIPNTNDVNLLFRITEEDRAKVKRVMFKGNSAFKTKKLRKTITTRRSWWQYVFRFGGYFDEAKLEMDRDALQQLYSGKGYLDFQVDVTRQYNASRKWVTLSYHVKEGPSYVVSGVRIEGNQRFGDDELAGLVKLTKEQAFDSATERSDIERLKRKYEKLGYLDLSCYPVHTTDSTTHRVAVVYIIREGKPSRIRDVHIIGNQVTRDGVIRRELAIHPGDLGDAGKIRTSQRRLENLGYFETVDVIPVSTARDDEKDLQVKVEEKRTGQLMLGAGISSEDSALGFIEIAQSNFDWRSWPTFRGGGQRLRLRAQLGTERTDFTLSFTEPWWLDRPLRLDLDIYNRTRYEDEYDQAMTGAGAMVTWRWRTFWRQSLGLRVGRIELEDVDDDYGYMGGTTYVVEEGSFTVNRLVLRLARDTRNRVVNPSRGSRLGFTTELTPEALGSYADVVSVDLEARKYFPVFKKSTLRLVGEMSVAKGISEDAESIPVFDRYFSGGAYSVRGFKRRSISPLDVNENPIGGLSRFTGSVELSRPLFERIIGSVFCDFGNVWPEIGDLDPADLNVGVGVGVLFNLPIGPIRLDYGWRVVTKQEDLDTGGRLHFNLGTMF